MYIRDLKASFTRPVKEPIWIQKIRLGKGEEKEVTFSISEPMLRFNDQDLAYRSEPGEFKVFIGSSSVEVKEVKFYLVDSMEK
jgi:beta-glucosidase